LVTNDLRFCLGDFGLTLIMDGQGLATTSSICGGSLRWMAPELLQPSTTIGVETSRDVYAFACTAVEVRDNLTSVVSHVYKPSVYSGRFILVKYHSTHINLIYLSLGMFWPAEDLRDLHRLMKVYPDQCLILCGKR
jgi:serine/threonine protein kinase